MKQSKFRKEFRAFKDQNFYDDLVHKFSINPFNFKRLNSDRELLINFVGDFLIVPNGSVKLLLQGKRELLEEKLYHNLLANNFISESNEIKNLEVLANRYRAKKSNVLHFATLHIFVITLRCEHTCKYCQVSRVSENKEEFDFKDENLFKAINLMLSSPEDNLTMEFQGGEALLAFDQIQKAIRYTQNRTAYLGKNINYVICTNLAPLTEEILHYCKENKVLLSSSLDGHEYLHNKNRPKKNRDSHQLAIKGINLAKEVIGLNNISALMTTTVESLKYPIEIIDQYRDLGFNSIFLRPISPYGFATKGRDKYYHTKEFLSFFELGLNYIIELNKKGENFKEIYTSIILKKILTSYSENYVDLMSPSGLVNSVIVYDYDGKVFVSDEARMLAQMNDLKFSLGTVDNTWEELLGNSVIGDIANSGVNDFLAGCDTCAYNVYCGSDPVHHHATQGDSYGFRPTSSFCERNMGVFNIIFEKIDNDPSVLQIFQNWVKNG
ncbi:His-Xaa-Ser system radical SAM maturase HxsB [Cellulophaga sp. Asnod2-G02]|uniref:His-Xaa-Ser system radical SAM maturase HxsB n=1 Tax=Cellulophaga sp. Asnod2-G02 TaxID=3160572 RepID=UPI0038657949